MTDSNQTVDEWVANNPIASSKMEMPKINPETVLVDPNFVLVSVSEVCDKHNVKLNEFLASLGFNKDTLLSVLVKKTISEIVKLLSRQIALNIYAMSQDSSDKQGKFISSLAVRNILYAQQDGDDFLDTLDKIVFPYMNYYNEHGTVDENFFDNGDLPDVHSNADDLRELVETALDISKGTRDSVGDESLEEVLEITHGEEAVVKTTEEEVAEVESKLPISGDIEVEDNTDKVDVTE